MMTCGCQGGRKTRRLDREDEDYTSPALLLSLLLLLLLSSLYIPHRVPLQTPMSDEVVVVAAVCCSHIPVAIYYYPTEMMVMMHCHQ